MADMLLLAWTFFKIGLFTFGGGYAMIPLIISELTSKGFVTYQEVIDIIAVSQVTPGTFAINAATFSGVKAFGVFGGIFATLGVMFPSLMLATLLAKFYLKFQDNRILKNTMYTMRPIVLGLIAGACVMLIPTALLKSEILFLSGVTGIISAIDFYAVIISVLALLAVIKFKISPIYVVLSSGVLGVIFYALL